MTDEEKREPVSNAYKLPYNAFRGKGGGAGKGVYRPSSK